MDFITLLFLLLCGHFLCDYPLQGDFLSKFKAKYVGGEYNPIWYHCLTAHSMIHALPVLLLTHNPTLAAFMTVSHFIIDKAKCDHGITFNQDQALHILIIVGIAVIHFFGPQF